MMKLFKTALCTGLILLTRSIGSTVIEKTFIQGPHNQYLMNSSTLFLPTDSLTMDTPIIDARTVVLNSGVVGGLDSLVPMGVESKAFRDSNDGDYFYQMWHFAHIDDKRKRTNVVTIIVSLGDIRISPSGDISDADVYYNRVEPFASVPKATGSVSVTSMLRKSTTLRPLNSVDGSRRSLSDSSSPKVYVQVYRTWSVPSTIPLSQANMDGWWHSITNIFHKAVSIYNRYKEIIGIAKVVYPILISLDDTQPGLGLKSIKYSTEPQAMIATDSSTSSSSTSSTFTYALTPGEMSAVVIFVFLSGVITTCIIPKMCPKKPYASNTYKLDIGEFESRTPGNNPLV
jgi:hypothetical protein